MTDKFREKTNSAQHKQGVYCKLPERSTNHFCSAQDPGIVVEVEIQAGDPVDSQIIKDFMSEFEAFCDKRSAWEFQGQNFKLRISSQAIHGFKIMSFLH